VATLDSLCTDENSTELITDFVRTADITIIFLFNLLSRLCPILRVSSSEMAV